MEAKKLSQSGFLSPDRLLLLIAIALRLLISWFPFHYGIFRDELYHIAMSHRLALGYVDVPPLAPFLLAVNRFLLGDSIFALHFFPALSGALFLWLTYRLVKTLGGNNYAILLALAAVLLGPFFVYAGYTFTYDAFSMLFWLLFSYLMVRLIKTENPRYWIYIGIAAGFGLLSKITILYLGLGWVAGLLLTKQRRLLWRWEVPVAGVLALAIFSPYLFWQVQHGFVSLEYYHNYIGKLSEFSPLNYIMFQNLAVNPATVLIWIGGLFYLFTNPKGKTYRSAAIAYLIILVLNFLMHAKPDLLLPFYAVLLAAGSVWLGNVAANNRRGRPWAGIYTVVVVVVGILCIPMVRPALPVKTYLKLYSSMSGHLKEERNQTESLPQILADRFGWEEMTAKAAEVYRSLPAADRAKTCLLAGNYGEAGAFEFYGKKYGLPLPPVSGHNQYYIWGPGRFNGDVVISVGISRDDLLRGFKSVTVANQCFHPYAMSYENQPIYLCREPLLPFSKIKPWLKWLN